MISSIKETCKKGFLETTPLFKHGLTISVKPKTDILFEEHGGLLVTGMTATPYIDDFKEFFDTTFFKDEDKVSYGSVAFSDISFFQIKEETQATITSTGTKVLCILAEADASITLTSSHSVRVHIICKNNSSVSLLHTILEDGISHKVSKIHSGKVTVTDILLTKSYIRSHVKHDLVGENSSSNIVAFYLTKGEGICDVYTENVHSAKQTFSDIVTKGVLLDSSKALSRGLVKISENAAHSEGYEQQDALVLSSRAEADAIPNLVIHNHDVKCSHGSTIGQIDEEQLFYLQSRGLSKDAAQNLLVQGYFAPAIDAIENDVLKETVRQTIQKGLE